MTQYNWNTAKVSIEHQSISAELYIETSNINITIVDYLKLQVCTVILHLGVAVSLNAVSSHHC